MQQKNPGKFIKMIMDLQSKMDAIQKELADAHYNGESANGLVKVTVTGKGAVTALKIDAEVLNEDAETVEALVMVAINKAVDGKEAVAKEKLAKVSAGLMPLGLKLPGMG